MKLNLNGFINVLKVKIQRNKYYVQPCYFDWICNISFSVFTYMISFCRYLISCLLVNMSYFVPHLFLFGSQIYPHLFFNLSTASEFFFQSQTWLLPFPRELVSHYLGLVTNPFDWFITIHLFWFWSSYNFSLNPFVWFKNHGFITDL